MKWVTVFALLALPLAAAGQVEDIYMEDSGYSETSPRSLHLVDSPTAAIIAHSTYRFGGRILDDGSVILTSSVGVKDRFHVGVSWGMQDMLGRGSIDFNDKTAISARLLLIEEAEFPAVALGFEDQGFGPWNETLNRYERKSKGFFVAATRNWYGPMNSDVATTVGFNYSTETDDDSSVDFFLGMEQDFGNEFALIIDYSLGLNDRVEGDPVLYGGSKGWLDLGLRWNIQDQIQFKFFFRDLLGNFQDKGPVDRHLIVSYENSF